MRITPAVIAARAAVSVAARLVGTYETTLDGKPVHTRICREGDKLRAQTDGQQKSELLPFSPTVFFDAVEPQEDGSENLFALGPDGRAMQWIWRHGGVEFPARRVS